MKKFALLSVILLASIILPACASFGGAKSMDIPNFPATRTAIAAQESNLSEQKSSVTTAQQAYIGNVCATAIALGANGCNNQQSAAPTPTATCPATQQVIVVTATPQATATSQPTATAMPAATSITDTGEMGPEMHFPAVAFGPAIAEIYNPNNGHCGLVKINAGESLNWSYVGSYWQAPSQVYLDIRWDSQLAEFRAKPSNAKCNIYLTAKIVPSQ